jgi:hypothetical protein
LGFVEAGNHENGFGHLIRDSTPGVEICLSNPTL